MKTLFNPGTYRNYLFIVVLIFAFGKITNATHIAAIDLNYQCVGINQYKMTLRIYRDCSGIALPASMQLNYGSKTCNSSGQLTVIRDTVREVSQICDTLLSSTTCGTGSFPGMEEHIYSAVLTLPTTCSDWLISFKKCCRNNAITNLISNNFNLFAYVRINNQVSACNNSPVFSDIPVMYACVNQPINFNNGLVDPDGDSLSYQLVNPLTDSNINIPYKIGSGFTPTNPLTTTSGFVFDSKTGQMTFTSPSVQQPVVSVLITEYDNAGNIKGAMIRDIQFIIFNCPTIPNIKISGVNYDSINYTYNACYGDTINFNVFSKSSDSTNPNRITFNNSLPGASFTSLVKRDTTYGNFNWIPGALSGTHYFTLTSEVDVCPIKRKSIFVYTINIDSVSEVCVDTIICLDSNGVFTIDSSFVSTHPTGPCGFKTIKVSKVNFDTTNLGVNYVDVITTYSNGYVDTCSARVFVKTIYPVGTICNDTTVYLNSNGTFTFDSTFTNYSGFYSVVSSVTMSRTTVGCYDIGTAYISYVVTDGNGNSTRCYVAMKVKDTIKPVAHCKDTIVYLDSIGRYIINPSYVDNGSYDNCGVTGMWVSKDTFDCSDIGENQITLYVRDSSGNIDSCSANVTVVNYLGSKANCMDTTIYLDSNGLYVIDSTYITNSNYHICFPMTIEISKDSFNCKDLGTNIVKVYVTDFYGDIDSCEAIVTVLDTIKYEIDAGKDTALCNQSTFLLNATSTSTRNKGYWYYSGPSGWVNFATIRSKYTLVSNLSVGDNYFTWKESNGQGCVEHADTILVQVRNNVTAHAGNDVSLCGEYSYQLSGDSLVDGNTGSWSHVFGSPTFPIFDNIYNPKARVQNLVQGQYKLIWTYGNPVCGFDKDTIIITVYDSSYADAGPDQVLCNSNSLILNGNSISNYSSGLWSIVGIQPRTPTATISNPTNNNSSIINLQQWSYQLKWTVKNGICPAHSDTMNLLVSTIPVADAGIDQLVCDKSFTQLNGDTTTFMAKGKWMLDSTFLYPSAPSFSSDTVSNPVVSNLVVGTYKFIRMVSNGVCPPSLDTVMIHVYAKPIVDAGIDMELCEGNTVNLSALAITSNQVGTWKMDYSHNNPSLVTFDSIHNNNTSVTNVIPGFYKFIWNVTSGACFSINDTIVVEIVEKPKLNLGTDVNLCGKTTHLIVPTGSSPRTSARWMNYYNSNNTPSATIMNDSLLVGQMLPGSVYGFAYEIQNRICPVVRDSVLISNNHIPVADFNSNKREICLGDSIQLFNNSSIAFNDSIVSNHWVVGVSSFTSNNPLIRLGVSGLYDVSLEVVSSNGCKDTMSSDDFIKVYELPIADFTYNLTNDNGQSVSNKLKVYDKSQWSQTCFYYFGNGDTSSLKNPVHYFQMPNDQAYEVTQIVSNEIGCKDTITQLLEVPFNAFFVPNAFTPNNDGRNDDFKPLFPGGEIYSYSFKVFNRWGELIYSSNSATEGWDGTHNGVVCKTDVYIWKLKFRYSEDGMDQKHKGHVNLLR